MKTNNNIKNSNSFEDVIKSSTKKNILFDFSKTWSAYLVLALLIIASFFIKNFVQQSVDADNNATFEKAYSSVTTRIDNQFNRYYNTILSTQGLYYERVQVVRDYFELTALFPVKNSAAVISMSYAPKVLQEDWLEFQYNARSQGYWPYNLHPADYANERKFYFPIEHIVVYELNEERLAFDFASQPIMKNAMEHAAAENKIVSTEFFDLRENNLLAFAVIAPVYTVNPVSLNSSQFNENFKGSIVMEIAAKRFFETALAASDSDINNSEISFATDTSIVFSVFDKDSQGKENIVFKSNNYSIFEKENYNPLFTVDVPIKLADRELTVRFATVPNFVSSVQANLPIIAFLVSLLISIIAFILLIVLMTQKAKAEEIAEKMTASQRRILDTSEDIIAVISEKGSWLSMNPVSAKLLGALPNEVIGTNITDYFYDTKDVAVWENVLASKQEHNQVEIKIKSKGERPFIWLSWHFTMPKDEKLIYAIGRDVTLDKEAAEEIKFRSKQIELAHCYEVEASSSKVNLMIQLSHEMRNQLTGIMGYLQLITNKAYDNEEELLEYANSANESSESAFTYIQDIAEITIGSDSDTQSKMSLNNIENTVTPAIAAYNKIHKVNVNLEFAEEGRQSRIIVDKALIVDVWNNLFAILTISNPSNKITLTANENLMEGVTEIIIEADIFDDLSRLIDIYNEAPKKVIERLREDSEDILLNIAKTASYISLMSGVFSIEKMNEDKTAYIFITLPLVMRTTE